ncbi:MAG: indolepyruvate oxidoreductase subunit beta [Xanthomonadales bacterium]
MQKNIILAGVGGQGILSIAFVIDHAAMDAGFHFKQAEVHGMAQRGGAVQSNLRYGDTEIWSDIIPTGKADMILAVEPLEALRYRQFLRPGGWVITSITPFVNIPNYPEADALLAELAGIENIILVDTAHFARAAGNRRAQNMVTVGAAAPLLDFEDERMLAFVERLFARKGEKTVRVNQRAFRFGRDAGLFFRALLDAGMTTPDALRLINKLDPETLDAGQAGAWAEAVAGDRLEALLAEPGALACDRIPACA